jgi:flavin-dependent dehydrogenase
MPVRATKRGSERTPFPSGADADVLVCGASFAGLCVARELRASGARVTVLDRYEIGERQTSACAAPTEWLENLGLEGAIRQRFDTLVFHTRSARARWPFGFEYATFDYPELCRLLWEQCGDAEFETATVHGVTRSFAGRDKTAVAPGEVTVHTDRGEVRAPLVVDALGWRRVLGAGVQPPDAPLSRGLEVHPWCAREEMEVWVDRAVIRDGYAWSFPAGEEVRIGVGSFDPRDHVKTPTVRLARYIGAEPERYQGNWIPHRIRPATEGGVFFAGDSAGHCIPLTAEGIRTAFYFGIACGRELRAVVEGRQDAAAALGRYHAFSAAHAWKFERMLQMQWGIPRLHPDVLDRVVRLMARRRLSHWSFRHYLNIAPPAFALPAPPRARASVASLAA